VRFEPPEEGSHQAELRAASNAREGLLRVRLSGQGVIPRAVLSPEILELGTGNFGPRRITVENTGGAPLAVDRLVVDGDEAAFPIDRDDCAGQRLPPGGSCGIAVRFAPVRPGRHEARLTVLHDGEGARRVRLVGDAAPPAPPAGLEPGGTDLAQPQPVDGCDALTLAWRAATDAWPPVSYDLTVEQISRTGSWETVYTATTPGTEERLAEPLGRRGTYRWRVVARDGVGNRSEPSPWRYFDCVARLE
jgi:hypothetical protein